MSQQLVNEIGNKYGLLTVKELTKDKNGRTAWLCQCDCGNSKIVRGSDLRKNKITTCGRQCKLKFLRNNNFKDLTNQNFGRLTVIYFKEINKNHKSVWHCKCSCGNECDIIGSSLLNGTTQSCGCLHKEKLQQMNLRDFTGQQFGYLTIIKWVYDENKNIRWQCKCQCGNIVNLSSSQLLNTEHPTKSCGCIQSSYERDIYNILMESNINFKKEQSFNGLISQKGRKLRYDFAIYKNNKIIGLIEFQGEQHFYPNEYFGGIQGFQTRQYHDYLKYKYAKNNSIPLLYLTKNDNIKIQLNNFLKEIHYFT